MSFAQDLRASVLQAAMQGKLTKRLKTDSKVTIKTIDIEAPFDIPETWVWCKIADVTTAVAGATPSTSKTKYWSNGTIPWLQSGCCQDCEVYEANKYISQEGYDSCSTKIMPIDTIMIALTGATAGKVGHLKFEACGNQSIAGILPCEHLDARYLFYYLQSRRQSILQDCKGSAQPHISKGYMLTAILALPPIEEQKRIVRRIEEIMKHINELEAIEEELKKLKEVFPADMKAAVLQAAMQGKLTEQLETDSSVDDLLEKIAEEREQLVKGGKIKKPKPQNNNFVALEDTPFDIPSNWKWVKFEDIFYKITDGTHKTPKYTSRGIHFVSVKDVTSGFVDLSNTKFISEAEHNELFKRCDPQNGDLLITKVGTTGIPAIVNCNKPFSLFVSVALLKYPKHLLNTKYLYFALKSPVVYQQAQENTRGIGNKNWVLDDIKSTVFPLPPIEEQQRIVDKLETILPLIEDI